MIWSAILGINCTRKVSNFTQLRLVKITNLTRAINSQIALQIMLLHILILFLNSFKIFPKPLLLFFSTNNFIVNACYTATFNIVLSEQRLHLRYWQIRVLGLHCQQINYNICASTAAIISMCSKPEVNFAPHPLLPHANACYYSGIILNSNFATILKIILA